jgi:hypothetical protein
MTQPKPVSDVADGESPSHRNDMIR